MVRSLGNGPSICVTLEFENFDFKRSTLKTAEQFSYQVVGKYKKEKLNELVAFLKSYGNKTPIAIPFPLPTLSPFRKEALEALSQVPFGQTLTYAQLALKAGNAKAARAAGSACHLNPFPLFIPCHRVVASQGRLGGFAFGAAMKWLLLDFEKTI